MKIDGRVLRTASQGRLSKLGGRVAQPCSVVRTRDRVQALATLAALAQISTPSATHFLKSHQLLVQKFAADRDRQRSSFESMGAVSIVNENMRG